MTDSSEESMRQTKKYLLIFSLFSFILGAVTIFWLVTIPSDPKNALLWGFSLGRLLMLGIVALGILVLFSNIIVFLLNPVLRLFIYRRANSKTEGRISGLVGLLLGLIALISPGQFGSREAIFVRILPLLTLLSLVLLLWALVVLLSSDRFPTRLKSWVHQIFSGSKSIVLPTLAILLLLFGLAYLLYPGTANEDFWYENGVPFLLWQLLAALVIGRFYIRFEKIIISKLGGRTNLVIFLLIFIFSGLLWAITPVGSSFFNPDPTAPNFVVYPFSDAQKFDLQAQSTLVGLGFNSGTTLDRPYYPLLLALIHLVSGQSYNANVTLQSFLFGIFPAIIFLIGAEVGSRKWGVISAAAMALWGQNYILVNSILNTATPKQMLTDFLMVVPLSLVMYFTIRWMKGGSNALVYAFITGGMIALAAYIRYSALALLPLWILAMILYHRRDHRKAFVTGGLLLAGFVVILLPWYIRNSTVRGNLVVPFTQKIFFVINDRYSVEAQSGQTASVAGSRMEEVTPPSTSLPMVYQMPATTGQQALSNGNDLTKPFASWFTAHLIHNIISSVMILPNTLEISSIQTSVALSGVISTQYWDGKLSPLRMAIMTVELFLLSMGVAAIFKRDKRLLVFLLFLFMGVNIANALGRTSGGRYIVPVNWVVLLVYLAGIVHLLGQFNPDPGSQPEASRNMPEQKNWRKAVIVMALVGLLPVFFELISLQLYSWPIEKTAHVDATILEQYSVAEDVIVDIARFQSRNDANLNMGYAYYPTQQLFTPIGRTSLTLGSKEEVKFLTFSFIEPGDAKQIAFPYPNTIEIQNQDLVILVGCKTTAQVIARDLFILRGSTLTHYQADPLFNKCN